MITLTLYKDKRPCLFLMSSFSPDTYILDLDHGLHYDRRLEVLQEIDVEALNLVRKALGTRDLFAIVLVRN
jgi:hypothetical protein